MFFLLGISRIFPGLGTISALTSGSFPQPLTEEEETKYLEKMQNGDEEARNILVEHNLRLVAHIVKKYSDNSNADDLISIGTIGLIKGINSYNSDKKTKLATYVARCIENEILMSLRHDKKYQSQLSLQEPIGFDGDGNEVSLMDVLPGESEDICERLDRENVIAGVYRKIKSSLAGRERQIIQMRYGLCENVPLTQREVARTLGISRSYVSRIEKRALEKLQ
ncbi:MAG: RNA polymerase sporulation sigma factor SigK [Clostridia bacterium]|nr:RNA polymerase sporulation sigma factor SigK [Clostridia bacterium]